MPTFSRPHQSLQNAGYTMVELTVVLSIISGIVATIWAVVADVNMNKHVNTANKNMASIVSNVRTIYAEQGGISNGGGTAATTTQALDQLHAFPLEMRQNQSTAAGVLFHEWNSTPNGVGTGNVQVTAAQCATGAPASAVSIETCFGVFFYQLTQTACAQFLIGSLTTATRLQTVLVNGVALTSITPDVNTATAACSLATTNSIEFVYLLKDNAT